MLPSESVERPGLDKARAWRVSSWNSGSSNLTTTRMFRVLSFHNLLTLIRRRKVDRYFDTGESGETYDAEMEAAASADV
jgi:hypothetical protein